jgi:hypothetical protein
MPLRVWQVTGNLTARRPLWRLVREGSFPALRAQSPVVGFPTTGLFFASTSRNLRAWTKGGAPMVDTSVKANDWQVCGVITLGGAVILGAVIYLFEFRSQAANFRGTFLFLGAGLGGGGDLNGATMPSPSDIAHNTNPDLWTNVNCAIPFSADDLNVCYGATGAGTVAFIGGYSVMGITAGLIPNLFDSQDVSGWGTGVGASVIFTVGLWQRMGGSETTYY